jgi:sugar phosphate permease
MPTVDKLVRVDLLYPKASRQRFVLAAILLLTLLVAYLAAYSTNDITAVLFITIGIGFICVGLPAAWSLILEICPANAVGAGAGLMNGVANAFSALAPILMGYLIATSGYAGGLMYLVGLACVGVVCMLILSRQKY